MDMLNHEATYDDLLKVPDHLVAEIVGGELFTSPRPGSRHSYATTALSSVVREKFQQGRGGPGGWWFLIEPELHLGRDVFVPDLAGWRKQRMPFIPNVAAITLAPDWICETVSVKTANLDRNRKLPRYAKYGIGHAWLVDPSRRGIEIYRLETGNWSLIATHEGPAIVRAEPFDAAGIDLSELWVAEP